MPTEEAIRALKDAEKNLRSVTPDVFLCAEGVGYAQAWKCSDGFYLECKGVKRGYYFGMVYIEVNETTMTNYCQAYLNSMREGCPLWEVGW